MSLKEKLSIIKGCISTEKTVPILTHICFDKDVVYAFDGVQAISTKYPSQFQCAVEGSLLLKMLSSLDEEPEISLINNELYIEFHNSEIKLPTLSSEQFIYKRPVLNKTVSTFFIDKNFVEGLELCLVSVNRNAQTPEQNGVTLLVNAEDGCSALYSTDTARISKYALNHINSDKDISVLLPYKLCNILVGLFNGEQAVAYLSKDEILVMLVDGTEIYSKLPVVNKLLYYENIINRHLSDNMTLVKFDESEQLLSSLKRSVLLNNDKSKCVDVSLNNGILNIKCKTSAGRLHEDFVFEDRTLSATCKFNPLYLKDALSVVEYITFNKTTDGRTVFIGKKGNYLHLLGSVL